MTSPHGSKSGGQPADLAVYDLRPSQRPSTLPLALGQVLLAVGAALILFGLWALASTTVESEASTQSTTNSRASGGSSSSSGDDTAGTGSGSGSGSGEARFDCNDDRTVCRFTAPNGAETYVCVEPCDLPTWSGEGTPVVGLSEGTEIGGADFRVRADGTLQLLPPGHDRTDHFQFVDDGNGGIELQAVGEDANMPMQFGDLDLAAPGDASAAADGDPGSADSGRAGNGESNSGGAGGGGGVSTGGSGSGGGGGLSLSGIAPILILLGIGIALVAVVIIGQAIGNRSDDDADVHHQDVHHQDVGQEEPPAPDENPAAAAAEVRVRKINDLIAELHQDGDPARAIQRAYAALETGFGNPTLARRPSETCSTYLHRTIGVVGGVSEPLRRLTTLFELARFSDTVIDEQMRTDAIASLSTVRDAWRARGGLAPTP